MSGKYALIIANTEYTDPGLAKLTAPGKDAEEFARVLKSPEIAAFDEVNTLYNENVFNANLAIEDFFARKKPDDLLVLYFSGHGVRDEYGSLYLAVKNTNRDRLRSTAINSSFIREGMDQSRSKRQVLILDCCNSGAFAQGTKAEIGGNIGTASVFEGTGYGRVVLTASDSTQFAWEGNTVIGETINSLFTHFLVKGLEGEADRDGDGRITVDELYDYAYGQIVSRTPKQTPGKWSYKQQGEIVLRQNIRLQDTRPIPLPDDLVYAINSSLPYVREGAVRQLEVLLSSRNMGLARSARLALEKIAKEDDSRRISQIAADILECIQAEETLAVEKAAREKVEKEAKEKVERETAEKAARERTEREATEKATKEKAEQETAKKVAKEKAEREAAEKAIREKAEQERADKVADFLAQGKGMIRDGDWLRAIQIIQQLLALAPDNDEAQALLIEAERGKKIKTLFDAAQKHLFADECSHAITKFKEVLELEPTHYEAKRQLVNAKIKLARQIEEDQKKMMPQTENQIFHLEKPLTFPEEIKSTKPNSLPEESKLHGRPMNVPK